MIRFTCPPLPLTPYNLFDHPYYSKRLITKTLHAKAWQAGDLPHIGPEKTVLLGKIGIVILTVHLKNFYDSRVSYGFKANSNILS